jgi:hypothetical protein
MCVCVCSPIPTLRELIYFNEVLYELCALDGYSNVKFSEVPITSTTRIDGHINLKGGSDTSAN